MPEAADASTTRSESFDFAALDLRRLYAITHLRDIVFVVGQGIHSVCEIDGEDPQAHHVLLYGPLPDGDLTEEAAPDAASRAALEDPEGGGRYLVGTARIFLAESPARVGRIAIHSAVQRRGYGRLLMDAIHRAMGDRPGIMHAQQYLERWYGVQGWVTRGEPFMEAEIPHVTMVRE